ncbi:hypothetical protein M440DRAFT_1442371 [Trichoderma longibrachiatum ATCC 18648]|uniref:Uncharacterized protein n=1 Tax=Trichoderma longibrachiatum ATCC 18648 TaxID=983965 RepID=A0A2T4BRI7_TRILO|nr:hypothetical protein M440DRAFT_1442371 [Trichoderma longibrachiatum ATCC 18648]
MTNQPNEKKGGKGKEPATTPPPETDVTEAVVVENPALNQPGQEQSAGGSSAAGESSTAGGLSASETSSVAEASAGMEALALAEGSNDAPRGEQALPVWQQRALQNGRTPLPDSRPPIAGEASGSQNEPTRRAPRPRWTIADIRRVIALARSGMSYADIRAAYYPERTIIAVSQVY